MRLPMVKIRITRGLAHPKFPRIALDFPRSGWLVPCLQPCHMRICTSTIQRRFLGAGVLVLVSLVTACGQRPQERASNLLSSAAETAESVVSAVGEGLGTPAAEEAEAAAPSTVPTVEAPPVRRPRQPARTAAASETPAAATPSAVIAAPVAASMPVSLADEAVAEPVAVPVVDFTVYSSADTDVIPPTPPVASGLRPWRNKVGPAVEVTVASDGTVEKVRVLGTTHMSDAMVLSHVKAWKFAPALRAGDPVRYRLLLDDPVVAP